MHIIWSSIIDEVNLQKQCSTFFYYSTLFGAYQAFLWFLVAILRSALEINAEKYVAKSRQYIRMNTQQELYFKSQSFIEIQDRKLQQIILFYLVHYTTWSEE